MVEWKAILLIYPRIDVRYRAGSWRQKRFVHTLSEREIEDGVSAFRELPALVEELTSRRATVRAEIIRVERTLTRLSPISWGGYWPGPADTRDEIDRYVFNGRYDSIFVLWPQNNLAEGLSIPSGGWGFGMAASEATNGATYATVANAPASSWQIPRIGEVWLHEWLHGVCAHFAGRGQVMPDGDADGGDRHGYVQSPVTGWMEYYCDLMNGRVVENGNITGIQPDMWQQSPRSGARLA